MAAKSGQQGAEGNAARYDYIVIGAGSAGCVVANRLSADASKQVLLIEAGQDDRLWHNPGQLRRNLLIRIPAGYRFTVGDPGLSWNYMADVGRPDASRLRAYPRGRVLGGSSSINGMLYVRGQAADYDRWAQMGCTGWSWDDVLPLFMRAEDQSRGADEAHGVGGPLTISDAPVHPVTQAVIGAAREAGFGAIADVNRGDQEGFSRVQVTMRHGRRMSASMAYLHPVMARKNLTVLTSTQVASILIENNRAVGVRVCSKDGERAILCRSEVILCGGVINSPQLLELSGIGDPRVLAAAGVELKHALPGVGANLQDHWAVLMRFRLRKGVPSINHEGRGLRLAMQVARYALLRRGILAMPPCDVIGFARSHASLDFPDVQISASAASADPTTGELDRFPGLTIAPCQLRPESRGHVHITNNLPLHAPQIVMNPLSAPEDRRIVAAAMRIVYKLLDQPALRPLIAAAEDGCAPDAPDEALAAYAERSGRNIFHGTGTCAMGAADNAVVDARLRVRGIAGLRVADASIMPRIVSGNTNAASMLIGEKASELILASG